MNGPDDPQHPRIQPSDLPYATAEQPSRAGRARVTAWILVVLVVLAGGGAALVLRATNAEQSVDKFVPENVAAFVKVSLKPSSSQRDAVKSLIGKLPADVQSKIQPKIDEALDGMFKDVGLSYTKDVKPWIGGQIGIAVQPPGGSTSDSPDAEPTVTGLLPVRDASAARVALDKVHKKDPTTFYKIFGSMVYLGQSEKQINDFRASVTQGHTLAENATYKKEYARAGANSLVFAYLNVKRIAGIAPTLPGDVFGSAANGPQFDVAVVSLQATSNGLTLVGRGKVKNVADVKTFKPELLESTGSDLLGAISVFNIGEGFQSFLKAIEQFSLRGLALPVSSQPDPVAEGIHQFEQALGLDLKKDVFPWLRGELSIVVGQSTQPPLPNIGVLIHPTDNKALDRTMAALRARLPLLLQGVGGRVTPTGDGFTVRIGDIDRKSVVWERV